ncbi:MAG: class I SAM-dependent methyltransferase [Vicinamibacterales bacterium]
MGSHAHWNTVYTTKGEREVSWFEPESSCSLQLIDAAGVTPRACVIDVGGGDSHLADALLERGFGCLAVLDISGAALRRAQDRLGAQASGVTWIEADVTREWSWRPVDVWHDRAVFHFLTAPADRDAYRRHLLDTLKVDGTAIIATFALDGPEKCSGLPVSRYSPALLAAELGDSLELIETMAHVHATPWGATQSFQYSRFRRIA